MAKQKQVKARKDYPEAGIVKGDRYWIAHIKTGPRSSKTIRSLTHIPGSRLTTSEFKSGWLSVQEQADNAGSSMDIDMIRGYAEEIRELGQAARDSFDNMPEGLQQGDTGQMLEARADGAETCADTLDQLADEFEQLEEPDPDDEKYTEDGGPVYEDDLVDYTAEVERITNEVTDALNDMPD